MLEAMFCSLITLAGICGMLFSPLKIKIKFFMRTV